MHCNKNSNVSNNDMLKTVMKYGIIDAHGHLGYYKLFNIPDNSAEQMIKSMDRTGIQKICISTLVGLELDYVYGNNMVADAINRFGDRFMGYANINPFEQDDILHELERCFDKLNMTAIKLHTDLNECPADSKLYIPVYEFAHERKLVIMSHSWGTASNLAKIASKYYNVKYIQAHYGSSWDGNSDNEIINAIKELDNAYLDTAGSGAIFGAFEKTVDYLGDNKLIFGTDFPFFDPCQQIGNIVFSEICEEAKTKILRDNFLNLIEERFC